jgi:hypothetical protein
MKNKKEKPALKKVGKAKNLLKHNSQKPRKVT